MQSKHFEEYQNLEIGSFNQKKKSSSMNWLLYFFAALLLIVIVAIPYVFNNLAGTDKK